MMYQQPPLPPFIPNSDTSYAAAKSAARTAPAQRQQVYATLVAAGPLTAEQLAEHLGLSGDSIRPRLVELRRDGDVVDTGQRRKTAAGRFAVVWAAA
jgi:predicted ArsR family transcriptional regulator